MRTWTFRKWMDWPAIGLYSAGSAVRPSSSVRLRRRWETYYRRSEAPRSTRLCPSHPSPLVCTASSTSMRPYRRTVRTESGPLPAGAVRQRGFELNRDPHRCVLPKAINRLRVIFIQFHRLPLFASPSHILSKDVCYCSGHAAVARTRQVCSRPGFGARRQQVGCGASRRGHVIRVARVIAAAAAAADLAVAVGVVAAGPPRRRPYPSLAVAAALARGLYLVVATPPGATSPPLEGPSVGGLQVVAWSTDIWA